MIWPARGRPVKGVLERIGGLCPAPKEGERRIAQEMKRLVLATALFALVAAGAGLAFVPATNAKTPPKPLPRPVIYVESQGLCYKSIVTAQNLPAHGPFQVLEPDPDNHCGGPALKTQVGPRDPGYVGGRWIMTMPDGTVVRFLCPLLGPGYPPSQ